MPDVDPPSMLTRPPFAPQKDRSEGLCTMRVRPADELGWLCGEHQGEGLALAYAWQRFQMQYMYIYMCIYSTTIYLYVINTYDVLHGLGLRGAVARTLGHAQRQWCAVVDLTGAVAVQPGLPMAHELGGELRPRGIAHTIHSCEENRGAACARARVLTYATHDCTLWGALPAGCHHGQHRRWYGRTSHVPAPLQDKPWCGRALTRGLEFSSYAYPLSRQASSMPEW